MYHGCFIQNDFSIIENAENKNTEFDNFINDCVLELNEIKYEEDEKQTTE